MTRIPRHGTFPSFPLRSSRPISAGSSSHKGRSTPKKTKKEATIPQRLKVETQDSDVFILTASNVEPGSAEWQYCSLPLAEELARGLAGKWPGIETTYLRTLTGVFVMLRSEREAICQYFYLRRSARQFGYFPHCKVMEFCSIQFLYQYEWQLFPQLQV